MNIGSKHKFKRFGDGIYSTSCSSKADDYSSNSSPDAKLRVLIVSRVVVGKSLKMRKNATDLNELPCGYHSVREAVFTEMNLFLTVTNS